MEKNEALSDKQIHIIDVAEKLFAEKGFEGTSVRDIAHEADVNIAMISYYFGSKEKLLEAVFARRSAMITQQLTMVLDNKKLAPIDKVYLLIDFYIDQIIRNQHFHKIMVREQIAGRESSVGKAIAQIKSTNQSLIKQLILEGQKKRVFKHRIDVSMMMMTLIGTANQMISAQQHYRILNDLEDMPDDQFETLIHKKLSVHLKNLFKAVLTYES
ncbi:MAG: TetR/AcrR family transcriptional regulator [Bacteroidetes bacterium]|nr:TetR/AcrR family transcriptional regulator [Bacteroidota bacterium]MBS1740185.1 TetR/AcrR family transcriptional regulator [Bacteroidota bacterium]MBS1776774.1 TetR/AcrR family transcriptional regulator [Bacteroidota bacterium]